MPDFGLIELLGGLGGGLLAGGEAAGAGLGEAALGLGEGALGLGEAAAPLSILPEAAAFTPAAVGDVFAPGLATGGLGFGGTGLGGAIGTDASGLGIGAAADAALPSGSTLTSGTGLSLDQLATNAAVPGVTGTGPITTPASLTGPLGGAAPGASSAVAPISSAAGTVDLTGVDPSLITDAGGASQGGSFLDKLSPSALGKGAVDQVSKNPLGAAAGLGLLGTTLLGNKKPEGTNELRQTAQSLSPEAAQLRSYLTAGTLPPSIQANVNQATQAAKQKVISNYAARGLPTDPTKNSSLAAELAQIDQNAVITTGQIGQQLLQSGLDETRLSTDIYNKLVGIDQTEQAQIRDALSKFASAMGGGGGINLKLA